MSHSFLELVQYMSTRAPILIARKGIEIALGLLVFAVLARTLSKEQFATYSLLFGVIAILRLTALPGLGTAVTQSYARGRFGNFLSATLISVLGSLVGSSILVGAAVWHFHIDDEQTGSVLLWAAALFPLFSGLQFWKNAFVGRERYHRLFWYDSASAILKCGAVLFCAYAFPGALIPVVLSVMLAPVAVNVLATATEVRQRKERTEGENGAIPYGVKTSVYQVPPVVAQHLDKLALFYLISPEALAVYAVALRIPDLARAVVGETNATLGPLFARQSTYTVALQRFSVRLWLVYLGISVAGAVFVVPYLLPLLAGERYADSVGYAQVMTIGVAMGYLGDIQFRYVKSHLHGRAYLMITSATAVADSVLILALAYLFGLGGVVWAYFIKNITYTVITSIVMRTHYLNKKLILQEAQGISQQ